MRRLANAKIRRVGRAGTVIAVTLCLAALWFGAAAANAAIAPWSPLQTPWGATWAAYDVYAFGETSLAAAGDQGHIAVTRDGGWTWKVVVPDGHEGAAFTAIAMSTSGNGAVASGGLLLVTGDGGTTWRTPDYTGPRPGAAINDIALRGSQFVAVGDDGIIFSSADSGSTWSRTDSPTTNAITCVAIAGDGTVVVGSDSGEIVIGRGEGWTVTATAAAAVTSVATSPDPVWEDGAPDLIAAAGSDVLGSDDALTFAPLLGLPDASSQPWSKVAWSGVPDRSLLIAGASKAGYFDTLSYGWVSGVSGVATVARAVTPAGQSVSYLLGADGRLVRTMSAARVPATAALGTTRIAVGGSARLTATVRVGAPGTLLLRTRVPGRAWTTQRTIAWASTDWNRSLSFTLEPSLTHDYVLEFEYGKAAVQLTEAARLVVVPRVTTTRSRYDLRRGDVYRYSGTVSPKLSGERVELYTDRGGSWRPVSLQRTVALVNGRTWTSRQFGAPVRETYHLRAHLAATKTHAEAWSRVVTVSIR